MYKLDAAIIVCLLMGNSYGMENCCSLYLPIKKNSAKIQQNPYSVDDLLKNDGAYLKQLVKDSFDINCCQEFGIAQRTLRQLLDSKYERGYFRSHWASDKALEEHFGKETMMVAHDVLKRKQIRKALFSFFSDNIFLSKTRLEELIQKDRLAINARGYSRRSCGKTLIHFLASKDGLSYALSFILAYEGTNPHMLDQCGRSPLFYAVSIGSADNVFNLLQRNVCVHIQDCDGNTPLHFIESVYGDRRRILVMLANNGANPNVRNKRGETPFHVLVQSSSNLKVIKCFLKIFFQLNLTKRNKKGQSYLDLAISLGQQDYVRLIRAALNEKVFQLLAHHARNNNACKKITKLIKAGADIDAHHPYSIGILWNYTVLACALENKCEQCVCWLLNNKVNTNNSSTFYTSYLEVAFSAKFYKGVKLLIDAGTNINAVDKLYTPLVSRAHQKDKEGVKVLIEYGALVSKVVLDDIKTMFGKNSIFKLLTAARDMQTCCVCFESQQSLDASDCLLSYIPCNINHRSNFICKNCYEILKFVEGKRKCPFNCDGGLGEFPEVCHKYRL